jgi:hypothetical protein
MTIVIGITTLTIGGNMTAEKKTKSVLEHRDKLGKLLAVGDAVCYPDRNSLELGTVKKLNPKMVKVFEAGRANSKWYSGSNKYPQDLVKIDGPEVTMYLLKINSGK